MVPFRIEIPDHVLQDLRRRLVETRFPEPTPVVDWQAGTSIDYLRDLVRYWASGFDWRAAEGRLNQFPQYTVEIDGQSIHFAHVTGAGDAEGDSIPIVITHGWPYSFVEMLEIVPHLVDPAATGGDPRDRFDVVVPSLPGYGFSSPLDDRPFVNREIADLWHRLMTKVLGYRRYATYGEDVGAGVSDWTAALFPEAVLGIYATHAAFPPEERKADLTADESKFVASLEQKWRHESAYSALQATKPDTLAVGLTDSPAGLAAWLVEKFRTWSGGEEAFAESWTDDDVLTTATLYWVTGTVGTSFRPYFDGRQEEPVPVIEVPAGVSVQFGERGFPRSYAERTYRNLRFWRELPRGGHFTVKQSPDLIAHDIREFFRPLRV